MFGKALNIKLKTNTIASIFENLLFFFTNLFLSYFTILNFLFQYFYIIPP